MISPSLSNASRVADWLDLSEHGSVVVRTGKVELGQGILTVIAQVAGAILGVGPETIRVISGVTGETPNESYTAGSLSVSHSATAVEAACYTCVYVFCQHIARQSGIDPDKVDIVDGRFSGAGIMGAPTLWSIAREVGLDLEINGGHVRPLRRASVRALSRIDFAGKMAGGGMIQDITADDMLHARILRPPRPGARPQLGALSRSDHQGLVVEGAFVALVDDDPIALDRKTQRLARRLNWTGGLQLESGMLAIEALRDLPQVCVEHGENFTENTVLEEVRRLYQRPYLMHASIGCVTALARWKDGYLSVISQTQGPYQLRDALAVMLDLDKSAVTVRHAPGAGCYGHNGADDVAADAALIARHFPRRTVRVAWTRAEEFASAPVSTAGELTISTRLDDTGRPISMKFDILCSTHARRPGTAAKGTRQQIFPESL